MCKNATICREWDEIKNIAFCKASKLATILPQHYQLYYVSTHYKTEVFHEWAKFIYGFVNKQSKLVTYLKLCVPVERKKGAWIDDRCPLDDCGELGFFIITLKLINDFLEDGIVGDCRRNKEKQKVSFEILNEKNKEKKSVNRMDSAGVF